MNRNLRFILTALRRTLGGIPIGLMLLHSGCSQDPSCDDFTPEPGQHRLHCDRLPWTIHVPEECPEAGCGLIVDVHGGGMSTEGQDKNTELSVHGTERGFIVAQPQGPWFGSTYFSPEEDKLIRQFLERARDTWNIDSNRMHLTGISLGGWASWRFACHSNDLLASVAPLAAGGPPECITLDDDYGCQFSDTSPEEPLSVLYAHGHNDVYFDFDECALPQRDSVLESYALNLEEGESIQESDVHTWTRWERTDGISFEFIEYRLFSSQIEPVSFQELGGHCVPGSADLAPETPEGQVMPIGCEQESPFHWGEEVAKFFEAHPKTADEGMPSN